MERSQEISVTGKSDDLKKPVTTQKLSFFEKVGYSLGDLAANLVFQTLVTYLAYFYTDIYQLKNELRWNDVYYQLHKK